MLHFSHGKYFEVTFDIQVNLASTSAIDYLPLVEYENRLTMHSREYL